MKKVLVIIAVILVPALVYGLIFSCNADANKKGEIYAKTALVTEVCDTCVVIQDYAGNEWCFLRDSFVWHAGDVASMIMEDGGTPGVIEDDGIVSVVWGGYIEHWG